MYVSEETINKFKQLDCVEVKRPDHVMGSLTCYMTKDQYNEYSEHKDTLEGIDIAKEPQRWNKYSSHVHFYFSHIYSRQNPNAEEEYKAALELEYEK
tara:strand:+ start:370 stop:660 length:291 start_codon:yes stop_codon:yes gene_type:complete